MIPIFLIGGGWRAKTFSQTYGRFLEAATAAARGGNKRRIAVIVAEEPDADSHAQFLRFLSVFEAVGLNPADEAFEIIVSAAKPLTKKKLSEINPTGVFVCGGLTPVYADALCADRSWLEYLIEDKIPYGGFSAGASVAAERAIVGGWRRKTDGRIVEVANENAGEDLDFLAVRAGLGLVPFTIDVHATQWGTLSRLLHAVDARFINEGFAVDENTMLEIIEGEVKICGAGSAYHVRRADGKIIADVFQSE
jgi:cyanophycinase